MRFRRQNALYAIWFYVTKLSFSFYAKMKLGEIHKLAPDYLEKTHLCMTLKKQRFKRWDAYHILRIEQERCL